MRTEHPAMSTLLALSRRGIAAAPRVASRLHTELKGDTELILELAARLSPDQLAGRTAIQDPLPLTPGLDHRTASMLNELSKPEQAVLLRAAVCVHPRTTVLLDASELTMTDLAASTISRYLKFVAGRFEFADPRLRSASHERATLSERNTAHADLAAAFASSGNPVLAHWHHTLSTVEGDSELAPPLLALAQRSFDIGEAIWAHAVAREAACHAEPELQPQAHLIAAETALHAGYLNDAQKWLSGAALASDPAAGQADPTPQQGSGASSTADWLRELDDQRVPLWLTEISSSDFANSGQRPDAAAMQQLQRHRGRILKAFQLCEEDDFDAALAQLAQPLAAASASASATPLLRSLRRTARALVLTWAGRFPEALTSLQDALFNGPGELVLGGIAGELSARLELLTSGEPSALSNSLFRLPGSHRDPVELLLDRSMNARFEGHAQEAAAFLDVASGHASGDDPGTEPSSQRRSFFLPSASAADPVLNGIGRSLRQLALTKLRYQITADRQLPEEQLESLASELNTLGRPPASSFDRGLAELELGLAFAHREPAPAPNGGDKRLVHVRRHLIAAGNSFENCGSSAWQRIAEQELADINAALDIPRVSVPRPTGIPATSFPPTLETARAEASAVTPSPVSPESADHRPDPFAGLTEREAEVAAFVAAGLPNREVAQKLHLSVRTVEVHLSRVFTKLGLRSRVELSILAHRITDEH